MTDQRLAEIEAGYDGCTCEVLACIAVRELLVEVRRLREDERRMDWLESLAKRVSWNHKAWLCRGGAAELLYAEPGEKWPEGVTQATARAAIDAEIAAEPERAKTP